MLGDRGQGVHPLIEIHDREVGTPKVIHQRVTAPDRGSKARRARVNTPDTGAGHHTGTESIKESNSEGNMTVPRGDDESSREEEVAGAPLWAPEHPRSLSLSLRSDPEPDLSTPTMR